MQTPCRVLHTVLIPSPSTRHHFFVNAAFRILGLWLLDVTHYDDDGGDGDNSFY